jgi:hypothetical protein
LAAKNWPLPENCWSKRIQINASSTLTGETYVAYIKERGSYWRAEVIRKGHKPIYRTFDTQKQAQRWARRVEAEIDAGPSSTGPRQNEQR